MSLSLSAAASSNRTVGRNQQKNQSDGETQHPPSLQVFMVSAPAKEAYRERLLANARGWYRQFSNLTVFTFDEMLHNNFSALMKGYNVDVHHLPMLEKNKKHSNLLMAAFGAIYKQNPNADYYFMAEDDTVLVKKNIEEAVVRLGRRKDIYYGRCVAIPTKTFGKKFSVMGGAGKKVSFVIWEEQEY
jgi:hypothetical protein